MMAFLAFLIGVFIGYNLAQYDTRYAPENATHAKIKVGTISKKNPR